jgi:type I restriction-modification system DNA methylase subunit
LRIAEDRNIEPYGNLKNQLAGDNFYQNIQVVFAQANDRYNSGLFDPNKDQITATLSIDNKVIKDIVTDMYYPKSPYLFDVISVEILGSAYEQFLGKTITINNRGKAIIELKPEVRKAGGVYYTPQYIVDYIVENTVGKLLENKSPKEASELKICDPACGSGSFLLGAYQYLLNWHKDYYTQSFPFSEGVSAKSGRGSKKDSPLTPEGNLTTAEKKRILLNNIFGVDIDTNAVEVTKLSLLLKCMEGETQASISHQMTMFHERVLPTLDENIKSGNSLIDTDFYDGMIEFEERKIKPFNWQKSFPNVFKNGGFAVVIGNPPYVLLEGEFRNDITNSYFRKKFEAASYKLDLYHIFIEQGINLLIDNGLLGFITPSNFLSNNGLVGLRNMILNRVLISELNVINGKVFLGASVDTVLSILKKTTTKEKSSFIHSIWNNSILTNSKILEFDQDSFKQNSGSIFISTTNENKNIKIDYFELGKLYDVKFGMQLRDRKKYVSDVINESQEDLINEFHRPCYTGRNVSKWMMSYSGLLAYFNREAKSGGCWDEKYHNANPKIIVRQIGEYPICGYDDRGYCCLNTVFMIVQKDELQYELKFILGILNSKYISNYWKSNFSDLRQTFPKIKGSYLEMLPIVKINFDNKIEVHSHDQIVSSVDQLLLLNKDLQSETLESKREQIKRKIDHFEDKINELVYKLYDLTEEEIKIVENG